MHALFQIDGERLTQSLKLRGRDMKTSLGIWALGPMVTRFVPGGYKPQRLGETTAARVREAVEGLGDLIDGYEFHYPQELSEENLDEVRAALDGHDIYCGRDRPPPRSPLRPWRARLA